MELPARAAPDPAAEGVCAAELVAIPEAGVTLPPSADTSEDGSTLPAPNTLASRSHWRRVTPFRAWAIFTVFALACTLASVMDALPRRGGEPSVAPAAAA